MLRAFQPVKSRKIDKGERFQMAEEYLIHV
jgi:hypothetical protein